MPMAKRIITDLLEKDYIALNVPEGEVLSTAEEIILDELMVEDRLNEEVRGLLRRHSDQIENSRLDYKKLFDLTKQKLVRERNIVL